MWCFVLLQVREGPMESQAVLKQVIAHTSAVNEVCAQLLEDPLRACNMGCQEPPRKA